MGVSKNSRMNRGGGQKIRTLDGKEVKAVLYAGWNVGHGSRYMAGSVEGQLIRDNNGRPVPLKNVGELVYNVEK